MTEAGRPAEITFYFDLARGVLHPNEARPLTAGKIHRPGNRVITAAVATARPGCAQLLHIPVSTVTYHAINLHSHIGRMRCDVSC